jgi:hypothetical protein
MNPAVPVIRIELSAIHPLPKFTKHGTQSHNKHAKIAAMRGTRSGHARKCPRGQKNATDHSQPLSLNENQKTASGESLALTGWR